MIQDRPRLNRLVDGSNLPEIHGDRFRPSDYLIDRAFIQGKLGDILQLLVKAPSIISGLVVTQGVGDTISITAGSALLYDDQTPSIVSHNFDGSPLSPLTIPEYISGVIYAGITNLAIPDAVLDGVTVNYVKASIADDTSLQRGPADDPGTPYDAFMKEAMVITVDDVAPLSTELLLATFIGLTGNPFTFSADPTAGERDYDFGIQSTNGKVYVPSVGLDVYKDGSAFRTRLVFDPTADRDIEFPDQSGTLALLSDVGGGGGTGFSPLVAGFAESPYELITATEFEVDNTENGSPANDLIDPATDATESLTFDYYDFDAPQQKVRSTDLIGDNFLQRAAPISRAHVLLRWNKTAGLQDPISRIRLSKNGGLTFAESSIVRQVGLKESDVRLLTEYASFDSFVAVNDTTQKQLAQGFEVSSNSIIYSCELSLIRVGAPNGRVRVSLRGDASGSPSVTDVLAVSDWLNIADIATSFTTYRFTFQSQVYATAGSPLYLVLEVENHDHYDFSSGLREIQWRADSSAPTYTDGQSYVGTGLAFSGVAGTDHVFAVYGNRVLADGTGDISQGEVVFTDRDNYTRNSVLISYPESNGDTDLEINSTTQQLLAQQVRLARPYVVNQIRVRMKRNGTPGGQVSLSIYADNAGLPGSLLATAVHNFNANAVGLSEQYVAFLFDGLELNKDTTYWMVLDGIGSYAYSGANNIALRADASAPTYLSGAGVMARFDGSVWSTIATTTLIFAVDGAYADDEILATYDSANDTTTQIDLDDGTARERIGQRFTLEANAVIYGASLQLNRVGSPGGEAYVEIYSDSAGEPGTLLATSDSVSIDELPAVSTETRFYFETQLKLTKATTYWIVLRRTAAYTYSDGVDELQWFRDPTTPVHAGGGSSVYAAATWTPSTAVQIYSVFGYEAELTLEVYGRKIDSRLTGFGVWYLFQDTYATDDPATVNIQLSAAMKASGAVPTAPLVMSAGRGMTLAVLGTHVLVGGTDYVEGDGVAYFDPADIAAFDDVTLIKFRQGMVFSMPTLEVQDRLRALPAPRLSESDVETIQFDSTGGATAVKVELPDGTVLSGPTGARVSFNSSKNRYGGLGLDTGSEAASTLYHIYAVKRPGTVRDLGYVLSVNSPSLGGPVGYRYWVHLGEVWNDGSSNLFLIVDELGRKITRWRTFTMVPGAETLAPTKGTVAVDIAAWRRNGQNLEMSWSYRQTGAGSAGTGDYLLPLALGLSANTSIVPATGATGDTTRYGVVGYGYFNDGIGGAGGEGPMIFRLYDATKLWATIDREASDGTAVWHSGFGAFAGATMNLSLQVSVPILNW